MQILSNSVEQTIELGRRAAQLLHEDDMLVLCGDLGAGKTHFTKGVAEGLGVQSQVTSPTFNILRIYEGQEGMPTLAHWDLYRLESEEQLDDVDFFGICESGVVALVEWGDKFPQALPDSYVRIDIALGDDDARVFTVTGVGQRGQELARQIGDLGADGADGTDGVVES